MTFLGYETTQWIAWLNLPELESSWKFLYTSSLATFSTLRRLLSIVKVGRVPDLRDFEMAVWSSRLADIEASEEVHVGADSFIMPPGTLCMHRKPNSVEGGPLFDWLTAMHRPVWTGYRSPCLSTNEIGRYLNYIQQRKSAVRGTLTLDDIVDGDDFLGPCMYFLVTSYTLTHYWMIARLRERPMAFPSFAH